MQGFNLYNKMVKNKKGLHRINRKKGMDYVKYKDGLKSKFRLYLKGTGYKPLKPKIEIMKQSKEKIYNQLRASHGGYVRLLEMYMDLQLQNAYFERMIKRKKK